MSEEINTDGGGRVAIEMGQGGAHDDDYRAIGRYVVEFSVLIAEMRTVVERQLLREDPMVPRLALAEHSASQVANAFFAICEQEADLDTEEKGVSARLKQEVLDAIKQRNDVAHGDWDMGSGVLGEPELLRTKPGRRAGAWVAKVWGTGELDAYADQLEDLSERVMEFAWLCLGVHPLTQYKHLQVRVRDIFRYQKHRGVLRKGRFADEPWFDED